MHRPSVKRFCRFENCCESRKTLAEHSSNSLNKSEWTNISHEEICGVEHINKIPSHIFRSYFFFFFPDLTFAALVLDTNCLPFLPPAFFLRAVEARWDLVRDFALDIGKHRSGFFLFLLVPQGPWILPSVPIRAHFWFTHFFKSPINFSSEG